MILMMRNLLKILKKMNHCQPLQMWLFWFLKIILQTFNVPEFPENFDAIFIG